MNLNNLCRLPIDLLAAHVLQPAAVEGASLGPFGIDRACKASLTSGVLEGILRSKNTPRDTTIALAAAARGLETNHTVFSEVFESLYIDEGIVANGFTRAFFSSMGAHGCLAGMTRVLDDHEIDVHQMGLFFLGAAKGGHLVCVLWAMEQLDELDDEWDVGAYMLKTAATSAFAAGHVGVLDAVFERPSIDAARVQRVLRLNGVDMRNHLMPPPPEAIRWLMRTHPIKVHMCCFDDSSKDIACAAIRVLPVLEVVQYVQGCCVKNASWLLNQVAPFAFQYCAPDVADALMFGHITDPISLIRRGCKSLFASARHPYRYESCDQFSTKRMVVAATRATLAATTTQTTPGPPLMLINAILDMMDFCGRDFEPQVMDVLDRFPEELEGDIRVLAVAILAGCEDVVERTLRRAVVTPENRIVALAAAQCASATGTYWKRLHVPGFFDDVDGTRFRIAAFIAASARGTSGFRDACRTFREQHRHVELGEAIWPSSIERKAKPEEYDLD